MLNIKEKIKSECELQGISISKLLRMSNVQSSDYYQAINGKKTFFTGWKVRIAEVLKVSVEELFPQNKEGK
jgi:hypothetical protein